MHMMLEHDRAVASSGMPIAEAVWSPFAVVRREQLVVTGDDPESQAVAEEEAF